MSLLSSERIHTGRVINLDIDTVAFPDGSTGRLEMIRHPGAAAVVPFLDDPLGPDPRVLLLRQFRHAADAYIWEIPAGRLDAGEPPETCARRELLEEAGMEAGRLEHLMSVFTTPGFTDERIHLFWAAELREGVHRREADEFLEVHLLPWSRVMAMIRRGELQDAKTLCALLFMQAFLRHR
ncbi:MAG TPA: NUDIX hydrolase [Gemmatimonadales bacterium]|nr:NUDIX hydrolase [Gemmatimonadales bacterium]